MGAECEARGIAENRTRGFAERRMRGGEMLPTLAVGWRASSVRGEEVRSSWRVHHCCGRSTVDTINCRQPSGLNKL